MTTISVVNLIILLVVLKRYPVARIPPTWEVRARRVAAIVFTIVCAYRSILPRVDVTRLCFFDTPLNWIIFGRTAATIAELCWALQMALFVRRLGVAVGPKPMGTGDFTAKRVKQSARAGAAVFGMACFAECWSWGNLITESNLFAVVEQGLWSALFLTTGIATAGLLRPRATSVMTGTVGGQPPPRSFVLFAILVLGMGIEQGYEAFDLYLLRYIADQKNHTHYQPFVPGIKRLAECAVVTKNMDEWFSDAGWMLGYFSIGVWSSIWLAVAHFPAHAYHSKPSGSEQAGLLQNSH